jgi:diguanylate cyclase (GGDEF)-like protein/PAS domain S-box-containing protein
MRTFTTRFIDSEHFRAFVEEHRLQNAPSVLIQVFTSERTKTSVIALRDKILTILPQAKLIGTTTDGAILHGELVEKGDIISVTRFEHIVAHTAIVPNTQGSLTTGKLLASLLWTHRSQLMFAFTDGVFSDGEAFLRGIHSVAPEATVAGGMASDGGKFNKTFVFTESGITNKGAVGAVLEGEPLFVTIDYGFDWLSVGQQMHITKAEGNRIYTINGKKAIEIYRHYLGEDIADHLPYTGIDFPLIVHKDGIQTARSVTTVYEDGSLGFSGKLHTGDIVTFGYGNQELILAHAPQLHQRIARHPVETLFVYSCTARKRLMPHLISQETLPLQSVAETTGFFTHGEFITLSHPKLFNQTLSVIGISESLTVKKTDFKQQSYITTPFKRSVEALSHLLHTTTNELQQLNAKLQKHAEETAAQRTSLQLAQEVGRFGSWEIDMKTNKAVWSKELYRIYNYPLTFKPDSKTLLSMVHPEDKKKLYDAILKTYKGKHAEVEVRVRRKSGELIHVWINGRMIFDENNKPLKLIGTTIDITERVRLREQNKELAAIIEESNQEIYIVDAQNKQILYVNHAVLKRTGYTYDEVLSLTIDTIIPLFKEMYNDIAQLEEQHAHILDTFQVPKKGRRYPVHLYIQKGVYNRNPAYILFSIDISRQVEAETRFHRQAQILDQIMDGVLSLDMQGHITLWNKGAQSMYGYEAEEILTKPFTILFPHNLHQLLDTIIIDTFQKGTATTELLSKTKEGKLFYILLSLSVLRDEKGQTVGLTAYMHDITQKKQTEERLKKQREMLDFQAHHDMLTLLPNRMAFENQVHKLAQKAQKNHERFAILFIDLDNFKHINDSLGHNYGDELLKIVAKRLRNTVRESDFLARLGGDEFTIVLRTIKKPSDAAKISEKIIRSLQEPFVINNHILHISASIGISIYPDNALTYEDLLKFADTAMYQAKENGKNNYTFYEPEMTYRSFEKITSQLNLQDAISQRELQICYQPYFNLVTQDPIGIEALIRWQHPQKGLLFPESFLPLAMKNEHYMIEMTDFVLHRAFKDYCTLSEEGVHLGILSLNMSAKAIINETFLKRLHRMLRIHSFEPTHLQFEISETELMSHFHLLKELLPAFNHMGIRIGIDDFGTGELSLHHLQQLPIDVVKIDISLIETLPENDTSALFVKSLLALSHTLDIEVIAEGVEKEEQLNYLQEIGCGAVQGFYYTQALPPNQLKHFYIS